MSRLLRYTAALLATLALATGCKTSTDGTAGTLNFAYKDPDNLLTRALDAPIAVGTRVELKIRASDRATAAQVSSASVDGGAKLISFDGDSVIVEGVSAGLAQVSVKSDKGEDTVSIEIAAADSVGLKPLNLAERALVGGIEPLSVERRADGELLVGEARVEGVALSEGLVERVDGPDHRVSVRYLTEGEVAVSLGESNITRTVVPLDVVADFQAETLGSDGPVGQRLIGYFQARDAADQPLAALGGLVQATVADESVCRYEAGERFGVEGAVVDLLAPGTCTIDLQLGSHSAQWSIEVKPAEQASDA